jgi:hypothetical protein
MAHHVTEANPTHHISECAVTAPIFDDHFGTRWYHMCGLQSDHDDLHECGQCGVRYL